MKYFKVGTILFFCLFLVAVLTFGPAFGQQSRATRGPQSTTRGAALQPGVRGLSPDQVVKLRKLSGVGRRGFVKNPEYRTSLGGTVGIDKDWSQITLEYATAPEWVDDLTFQFYALSIGTIEGQKVYSFYKAAVKYADIERGSHVCTMFLRPSAVKRFGELYAIAVEVLYRGTVVEEMTEEVQKMPPKWWKDPAVVENPSTVTRDGYLLNRAQSPFALISVEGFEFIK